MEFCYDESEHDVLILRADGGLNSQNAAEFVLGLEKLIDAGLRRIIVDCTALEYVSSYGLGVLVGLHSRLRKHGGDIKLAGLRGTLADLLHVTRLSALFEIYPDVNRARLAFRPKDA